MDIIKALPGNDRPLKPLVSMASTKVLKGFGDASVIEVVASDRGAYRAVYTTRFAEAVVVLHVFQKKSKTGIATPKSDMAKVGARLIMASELFRSSES